MKNEELKGRYIYGIIDCAKNLNLGRIGMGESKAEVSNCIFQDISALISKSPVSKYPITRENVITHQKVLEEAMKNYTVLPVRFCTIAEEEGQIKKILEKRQGEFRNLLIKMRGLTELGIKALWNNLEEVFKEIAEKNSSIKKIKQEFEKLKSYSLKVKLGELVKKALEDKKNKEAKELIKEFKPYVKDLKENLAHGDSMFLNAAFLVDKEGEKKIDQKVNQIIDKLNSKVKIKYVGPVPIFNFVEIVIHWE
ncbi:MAG: GvpL/GvpF family gas vesicle protein [Armatimonadetes bacterium]|nr:GvpL/GvpF family gas vesicle protein [Armatimonadota bacterium]